MDFADISLYASSFGVIALSYILAVVSPGPDLVMTMRNTMCFSRRTGLWGVAGTTAGLLLHLTYTILGIRYVAENYGWVLDIVKFVGGSYLIYIGISSFNIRKSALNELEDALELPPVGERNLSPLQAFRTGFLTNALNPIVVLLFIGILSEHVDEHTPAGITVMISLMIMMISAAWFTVVVLFLSNKHMQGMLKQYGHLVERICGGALAGLGLYIAGISLYELFLHAMAG